MADVLSSWAALPRRLFLDTSTLQTLFDYGEHVWDNQTFVAIDRDRSFPGLEDEVGALRLIMAVNARAGFQFVVTDASLREVDDRHHQTYTSWARDVRDAWCQRRAGTDPLATGWN